MKTPIQSTTASGRAGREAITLCWHLFLGLPTKSWFPSHSFSVNQTALSVCISCQENIQTPTVLYLSSVLVSCGCCNKEPQAWWLKTTETFLSRSQRREAQNRGVGRATFPPQAVPNPGGSLACGRFPLISASVFTWPPPLCLISLLSSWDTVIELRLHSITG